MSAPASRLGSWKTPLAACILVLAGCAAYHNSFSGPFIYDDAPAILDNRSIRHLWPIWAALAPPHGEGLTIEGRPVLNLSFAVNYAVSGTRVWSYHALNLAIHLAAGLALLGIVRRTAERLAAGRAAPAAGAAERPAGPLLFGLGVALIWTVHPLQTEAVTYVIQRAESLMGLFYLLTLYCFVRHAEGAPPSGPGGLREGGSFWGALSVACCLLGMGTKEVMVTAPVMILVFDRTFCAGSLAEAWRRRKGYYLALAATWLPLLGLIASTGGNRSGSVGFGTGAPWGGYILTQFEAVMTYLRLAVWPHPLVFEYGTFWVTPTQAAPYALAVSVLAAATVWALVRAPIYGFLGFWFFGILAPTSLMPGTTQMIVEHRMYLPLAALAVLFVLAVWKVATRGRIVAVAGVATGLGWTSLERNSDYRSELAIWQDTAARRPENSRAHGNLADGLMNAGQTAAALKEYAIALRLNPWDAVANNNYGMALSALGRGEEAIGCFERAVRIKPRYAHAHFNLANALVRAGRQDDAAGQYTEALRLDPSYPEASNNLGDVRMTQGRLDEAVGLFERAVELDPEDAGAYYNLGNALTRMGRRPEAVGLFEKALRLKPDYAAAHSNLGVALVDCSRFDEALAHFREAVRLQPEYAEARLNLGNALLLLGRLPDAVGQYQEALRLRPDYPAARRNLERAQRQLMASSAP